MNAGDVAAGGELVFVSEHDVPAPSPQRDDIHSEGGRGGESARTWIEKRIAAYREIARINRDDAEAHLKRGILHLLLKDRRAAREEYKILRDLYPSMADELMRKWNIKCPF